MPPALVQIAQSAARVCPSSIPPQQSHESSQKSQAVDLMFKIGCAFKTNDPIEDKTDQSQSTHLSLYNLIDITFPSPPDQNISIAAHPIILRTIKTTLNQKNAGPVIDGEQVRGLNQEIILTPKQLQTLLENSNLLMKNLEETLQKAREQSSSAPTLPERVKEEDFIQFASAYVKQSRDQ